MMLNVDEFELNEMEMTHTHAVESGKYALFLLSYQLLHVRWLKRRGAF